MITSAKVEDGRPELTLITATGERLPSGTALLVIAALSTLAWGVVGTLTFGLWSLV